jgi:predicted AlkP superfamily pyrophosphatase or phosphodiesterase
MKPKVILNVVGLTPKILNSGNMPSLQSFADQVGWTPLTPDLPAVTCTMQARFLTGKPPSEHGAVGNGWYFRDLAEIWLWRQSVHLLESETFIQKWNRENPSQRSAQVFWWWNLPSHADISVTPRPTYWANGRKTPDIHTTPPSLRLRLQDQLGPFPLFQFWGPGANIKSTRWIVDATLNILKEEQPGLTLSYLPHLDYDLQRFGPNSRQAKQAAMDLDQEVAKILDYVQAKEMELTVVSEYGISEVSQAVFPNQCLRENQFLTVHPAKNGALLDPGNSRAFAVCDHQCAHVYIQNPKDVPQVKGLLSSLAGVDQVWGKEEMASHGLAHPRSGELFLLAEASSWFAYPYWGTKDQIPDFARTVDIHNKPGYDPCELFLDPAKPWVKTRVLLKVLANKCGWRTLLDVIPLDTSLVKGSHGLLPLSPEEGPIRIGPALP